MGPHKMWRDHEPHVATGRHALGGGHRIFIARSRRGGGGVAAALVARWCALALPGWSETADAVAALSSLSKCVAALPSILKKSSGPKSRWTLRSEKRSKHAQYPAEERTRWERRARAAVLSTPPHRTTRATKQGTPRHAPNPPTSSEGCSPSTPPKPAQDVHGDVIDDRCGTRLFRDEIDVGGERRPRPCGTRSNAELPLTWACPFGASRANSGRHPHNCTMSTADVDRVWE